MAEMDPEGVLVELGEEDTIAKGAHASDTNAYERVCVWVRGTGPWVPHLHEVSRARKSTTHWAPRDRGPRRNERARGCSMGSAG
jgi:hypothetical protein